MHKGQRIDFDDLKRQTAGSFDLILAHYGIEPVGTGEQTSIHCPFHADAGPSCSVNLEKGLFHCFAGSCGAQGNHLEFVWKMETRDGSPVTLRQAALKLAAICGQSSTRRDAPERQPEGARTHASREAVLRHARRAQRAPRPSEAAREARPEQNRPLSASFIERFHSSLDRTHPYLVERGISAELADAFGIGYAPEGVNSLGGRLCVPIRSATGEILAFAGRFAGEPPEGVEKWMLPKGFHKARALFNIDKVAQARSRHIVVVEGFLDAVRLHGLRIPSVALMGTSISETQVELLRAHCPQLRAVTVMLDGDAAGRNAAQDVALRLVLHWWVRIVELPKGTDPAAADETTLRALIKG